MDLHFWKLELIPAGHRAAFFAFRNTNIFPKITQAKL